MLGVLPPFVFQSHFKIPTDCLLFPCFLFFSFLVVFVCFCICVSPLSLPWYSWIWRPWAFRERWELDKGCVKRFFLRINRCRGFHSSWGFLVYGIAHSIRLISHSTRMPRSRHFTRPNPILPRCLIAAILPSQYPIPPRYLTAAITPGQHLTLSICFTVTSLSGQYPIPPGCLKATIISGQYPIPPACRTVAILPGQYPLPPRCADVPPSPLFASLIGSLLF